jgi:hypothetical protein
MSAPGFNSFSYDEDMAPLEAACIFILAGSQDEDIVHAIRNNGITCARQ